MSVTRKWKVYGAEGHRQGESFNPSEKFEFFNGCDLVIIEVQNSDKTGTNDYSIVIVTAKSEEQCEDELWAQIADGVFENYIVGINGVVEIGTIQDKTREARRIIESYTKKGCSLDDPDLSDAIYDIFDYDGDDEEVERIIIDLIKEFQK